MPAVEVTQQILDSTQYTTESINLYEAVYGEDFVSPGGHAIASELIERIQLAPGCRVLDVGCGLGGSAFIMARDFGLIVDGIDLSNNMLSIAADKLSQYQLAAQVSFEQGDCLELHRPGFYDAIYSRDVFLHISNKKRLFSGLYAMLKYGGQLLFSDYCCGEKPWADEFSCYVKDRGYDLLSLDEYAEKISAAGFVEVKQDDMTERFVEILKMDLGKIETLGFSQTVINQLQQSWKGKLQRARSGDHRWGVFTAHKAA
ncbi:MAG: methyltransferase domain-containing protein [Gammaproteobacteria bacterium]|nr:methyltransferase domain-containing protein [Gammaproteobacteria bacterium]